MNRLPVSEVSSSIFTLGDEFDKTEAQQGEDTGVSTTAVNTDESSGRMPGNLEGDASRNGVPHEFPEQHHTSHAWRTKGTEEQPAAQMHSALNGKTAHAHQEAQSQPNGQAGEVLSSEEPSMAQPDPDANTKKHEDDVQAATPSTATQPGQIRDTSTDDSDGLKRDTQLPLSEGGQETAALPGRTEPAQVQTLSAEAEEQRIADELAALEAEAEALDLQEQHHPVGGNPDIGVDLSSYSVSLADESRSADRAMAEAHQLAEQMSSGATAMQSALDSYEPRARPFSPPPGSAPLQRFSPIGEFVEPPEFQGLLYYDGLDALGRPVVIINADAVAEEKHARKAAFQYLLHQLEPVVSQGPYVLVMVNTGRSHKSNRIQTTWLISAYRGLSRPFRKNVKFIILVRPSKPLKAFLTMLRPFLSRKAHRKVIKVESLSGIAEATGNEVTLQHLGARFAAAAGRSVSDDLSLTSPTLRGGSSPMFSASSR